MTLFSEGSHSPGDSLDLSGSWQVLLDPDDRGIREQWWKGRLKNTFQIQLPGSLAEHEIGDIPGLETNWTGSIYDRSWYTDPLLEPYRRTVPPHFPFWLTPKRHYVGPAWYEKTFVIPGTDPSSAVRIFLERCHWVSELWLDGFYLGRRDSLSTPHIYRCPGPLGAGRHRLVIRVDNRITRIDPGPDAHSVSDHTQGNWNGIVGTMSLTGLPPHQLQSVQVYPDVGNRKLKVECRCSGGKGFAGLLRGRLRALDGREDWRILFEHRLPAEHRHDISLETSMDEFSLWDEFDPRRYELCVEWQTESGSQSSRTIRFGFREFIADGRQFRINGRRTFLRGNIDCAVFPKTGYPPTDVDTWMRLLGMQKHLGVNHLRFHSWCPPEAAFEAADRLGIYLQVEAPLWPNKSSAIGDSGPLDRFLFRETRLILEHYGNHPSFVMFTAGNEPSGEQMLPFLQQFVDTCRDWDPRHLYSGASMGREWPVLRGGDFAVHGGPRGLLWRSLPDTTFDYEEAVRDLKIPLLAHEMGQFACFPDFREIGAYTGVYRAKNLEMFREQFTTVFSPEWADRFHRSSGALQLICYKAEIEAALRTPGMAGLQLLGLTDFPGQGTALIGVLNAFHQPKAYLDIEKFREFFSETVPLVRLPKMVFRNSESIPVQAEVAHHGPEDLVEANVELQLLRDREILACRKYVVDQIPAGRCVEIGTFVLEDLPCTKAEELELILRVDRFSNRWRVWMYPDIRSPEEAVLRNRGIEVFRRFNDDVVEALERGASVLLMPGDSIENGRDVSQFFRPVFWNTSWFQMKPPHTLGLWIDQGHPVFEDFPTREHSDYQWFEIVHRQPVFHLENFPEEIRPIVRPIDTWFLNRRLAILLEVRVGAGRLFLCSTDLLRQQKRRPVAAQLYHSILRYMESDRFNPPCEVNIEVVAELFEKKERWSFHAGTDEKPDELIPGRVHPAKSDEGKS